MQKQPATSIYESLCHSARRAPVKWGKYTPKAAVLKRDK
nr:MAG TPA_asm: hypothetical protein [Caudoviricetes sp.]